MWTHVSDAALMDVLEGAAGDRARDHVAACKRCRARVEDARTALDWTVQAAVPEPVPSYWEVFRRRVARALVEAPAARSRRPLWVAAATPSAFCSDVSECVVALTDDESRALADALRSQLPQGSTL